VAVRDPQVLIKLALRNDVGAGDSLVETLAFLIKTTRLTKEYTARELLALTGERIAHTIQYAGLARNIGRILSDLSEAVTGTPGLIGVSSDQIWKCVMDQVVEYVERAVEEAYNYCYTLRGNQLVMARGILALSCTLGLQDSFEETKIVAPIGLARGTLYEKTKVRLEPWTRIYQLAEEGFFHGIISQAEMVTPVGAIVTPGTLEIHLLARRTSQTRLLAHPLALSMGTLPQDRQLPVKRIRSPSETFEEEYPLLERFRWKIAGMNDYYVYGEKRSGRIIDVRRGLENGVRSFIEGVIDRCG